jgi:ATP-dependent DNA helicase RecG
MKAAQVLAALNLGEEKDWEFKSAKGGLPGSIWETYSAMANTDGGCIVLGVEKDCSVSGLTDVAKMKKNFWDTVNNRGKVSLNMLTHEHVKEVKLEGKTVLVIRVPRANRRQRPVFIDQNPLTGTYRRNFEGDYHCSQDEVGRMLADQAEEPADCRILENFGMKDLDKRSLQQYRQRFSSRDPQHPWLGKDDKEFLEKLGGWRTDRSTGEEGLTVAGLLMFGKDQSIRDPAAAPEFHLDYREKLSDDPKVRWTDRLTIDGTWAANLFQFYQRVIQRITADLKIPFQLQEDLFRKDDTIVHEAIREALVNAMIHADFRGQGGIVVEKYRDRFELSNPGTLLVSFDQLLAGGVSECRNKSLQTMFLMIGGGERAGSGIDKIRQGWRSQHWRTPSIQERTQPDRVRLVLPMVSLLPEESVQRVRTRFGRRFERLNGLEIQALVTADLEGQVTNLRLREMSEEHPTDLTKTLQGLVAKGFLQQDGQRRWTSYRLPALSEQRDSGLSHKGKDSSHKANSSHKDIEDWSHKLEELPAAEVAKLKVIAAPAFPGSRLAPGETRKIILALCDGHFLTAADLGELMARNARGLRDRFLSPMVDEGLLARKYPEEPNRPDQAYTLKKK